jgi:hypothetical protein
MTKTQSDLEVRISSSAAPVSGTEASRRISVQSGILYPIGMIDTGAMIWSADVVVTTLPLEEQATTPKMSESPPAIDLSANLMSNVQDGELRAIARIGKKGQRVSTARTDVISIQGGGWLDMTTTHVAARGRQTG